jgi:GT2 family glycosyltransferase
LIGANMAFRVAALQAVGLFDERLGPGACGHEEETEMSARLTRAGFRIGYAPLAVAFHEVDVRRANRDRFLRIARERGRCRVIHEKHSRVELSIDFLIARTRLSLASAFGANLERIAREEKRLATVEGMLDGLSD